MKFKYIQSVKTITALIAASFLLICSSANAQPGAPPWVRLPPRTIIVPGTPMYRDRQNSVYRDRPAQMYRDRQNYNQYNQNEDRQPYINFSIHFDPLISWFSTDSYDTRSDGVIPGFNFGVSYNKYFSSNYSFSSGINISRAGGRLINRETSRFEVKNYYNTILTVEAGEAITYRITYLSVPLGLKLQTNQAGFGRFFTDVGFDPKIVVGARADIPSLNIKEGNATRELNFFNMSFHVIAGFEYPLSGSNALIIGMGFENNIFDVTRDNGNQPSNVVSQKMVSFRIGMTF
jgi:hypothetical protein